MSLLSQLSSPFWLRRVLWADAASGIAIAALQLLFSGPLSVLLGLSAGLLRASALVLLAYVVLASLLAQRSGQPRWLLAVLVIDNWAWVAGCLWLAFGPAASPTGLGVAYLLLQAVAVAVLAELQWLGLRRAPAAFAA